MVSVSPVYKCVETKYGSAITVEPSTDTPPADARRSSRSTTGQRAQAASSKDVRR